AVLTDDAGEVILTSEGVRKGSDVANYSRVILGSGKSAQVVQSAASSEVKQEPEESEEDPDSAFSRPRGGFQDMMSEAISSAPMSEELSSHDEELREAAESIGMVPQGDAAAEILSALDSFSAESIDPDQSSDNADIQYDDVELEPITGSHPEVLPPSEEA